MADKIVVIKLDVQQAGAESQIVSLNKKLDDLTEGSSEYELVLKKITIQEDRLIKIQDKRAAIQTNLSKSTNDLIGDGKKGLKGVSSATGGATSAAMELGRVFSDAPYGIRGVANNISQLASQFSYMTNKVDATTGKVVGFNGAMKQFGQALKANAVLLAIQGVISLMDYLSVQVDSTGKSLEKLAESSVNNTITELILLKKALQDTSKPLEEKKRLIKGAREEYDDFNEAIKETPNDILAAIKALDLLTQKYRDFAKAKALTDLVTESMKTQAKTLVTYKGDWTDMFNSFESFAGGIGSLLSGRGAGMGISQAMTSELKTYGEAIKKFEEMLNSKTTSDPSKTYLELIYGKEGKGGSKVKKISPFKTPKELELDVKSNEDAILKFNNKIAQEKLKIELNDKLAAARTEEEKDNIRKDYAVKGLLIQIDTERKTLELKKKTEEEVAIAKTESHREDLKRAYELYKFKIENDPDLKDRPKKRKELLTKAKDTYGVADKQALDEGVITVEGIKDRYKPIFSLFNELSIERVKALWGTLNKDDKKIESDLAKLERYAKKAKEILNGIGDFVDGEYQRELIIEQNKTNVLNNELNERLLNENLSKEQRKTIQNEIAQNDETLRKKQESIEKKRFKAQKAINIATALIDTGVAAVKALKNNGGVPTGLPAMFGTIALGLAQVATIARTKFQSSAGSSPALVGGGSSSSSGTARAEASFNIVGGRTKEDALLGAIQAKFDQPIKAYVVSGDVTNQQQLDRVIVSSSSL